MSATDSNRARLPASEFRVEERLTAQLLREHPVWCSLTNAEDRDDILSWGVDPSYLNQQRARFDYCGPDPIYTVLQLDPLPQRHQLMVRVTFLTQAFTELHGYTVGESAIGLFIGDEEICLNRSLTGASSRAAAHLEKLLDLSEEEIFPLSYDSGFCDHSGTPIRGLVERYW